MAPVYRIDCSQKVADSIKELLEHAQSEGHAEKMKAAWRIVFHRLRSEPLDFGEPTHFLKHIKLHIRVAVVPPVIVHFGVNEEMRTVILQKVQALLS